VGVIAFLSDILNNFMHSQVAQLLLGANFRRNKQTVSHVTVEEVAQGIGAVSFHDCSKEWDIRCDECQHDMEIVANDL